MALTDEDQELMELQRAMSQSGATVAGLPSGAAVAADPEVIRNWELRRSAQRAAYGQFVANGDIYIGNCMTFASGQPVPLEHVIRFDLEATGQVNRVADEDLARQGKRFETDEQFLAANPHIRANARKLASAGELNPAALDPRGGGAAIDDARKAGDAEKTTEPGDLSEERQEAVKQTADKLADAADDSDGDKGGSKPARRRSASDKNQEG